MILSTVFYQKKERKNLIIDIHWRDLNDGNMNEHEKENGKINTRVQRMTERKRVIQKKNLEKQQTSIGHNVRFDGAQLFAEIGKDRLA